MPTACIRLHTLLAIVDQLMLHPQGNAEATAAVQRIADQANTASSEWRANMEEAKAKPKAADLEYFKYVWTAEVVELKMIDKMHNLWKGKHVIGGTSRVGIQPWPFSNCADWSTVLVGRQRTL